MNKQSGIYRIFCNVNHKQYIGSAVNLDNRNRCHFAALRKNTHKNQNLQTDFNLFGEKSFNFEIIEYCQNNLRKKEQEVINQSSNLYNIDINLYTILPDMDNEDIQKFWSCVDISKEDCWEWKIKYNNRRPRFCYKKIRVIAARAAFKIKYPDFDQSLIICHACDNPNCVRPDHLFLGTTSENMKDRVNKGRGNVFITKDIVDKIRQEYLLNINRTSTEMIEWTRKYHNININSKSMKRILKNEIFHDSSYEITNRTQCKKPYKLNINIVKEIRKMYKEGYKFNKIIDVLNNKYNIKICKPNISNICLNKIWIDNNYTVNRRKKQKIKQLSKKV